MTPTAPSVLVTAVVTAPFESSVRVWPPVASVTPPRTSFLKVARVPDDCGRKISTIAMSGPPTSFQLVVLPVQMATCCAVVRLVMPVTSLFETTIQPWRATIWSTSLAASGVASWDSAVTSESPIWTEPPATWLSPVPEPPPLTTIVAPVQPLTYCLAAASTSGCKAVEPAAVMLPVTHATDGAALADALVLAAVVAVAVAAVVSVAVVAVGDGDAPDEHAVTIIAAATARAPNRRVPFSNMFLLFLLGNSDPTSSPRFRPDSGSRRLTARWRIVNVRAG